MPRSIRAPILEHGNRVYGGEPNPELRAATEQLLGAHLQFTSLAARADEYETRVIYGPLAQ